MPLYEYKCEKCGDVFEVIQKFIDAPLKMHHDCGGAVERLISVSALQFKGTGWYITDYAKKPSSSSNGGEKKPEGKSDASGSKSESKQTESKQTESKPAPAPASRDKK